MSNIEEKYHWGGGSTLLPAPHPHPVTQVDSGDIPGSIGGQVGHWNRLYSAVQRIPKHRK